MAASTAIVYAAKSTEDKHGSIPDQLGDCRALAEREGWDVLAEHSDEGFSGYSGNRGPGLADARRIAAEAAGVHGSCVLVVQHSDRLARGAGDTPDSAEHLAEILFWARRHRVELRSVQDDSTFTNPLLVFAMGERNHEDSRRKSEAVKGGMRRRAERGWPNGGPRPYGYRWEGPKGEQQLVPDEGEAVTVRRIFEEYAAGRSQQGIQRGLNEDGVLALRGGPWHQGSVRALLANPIYKGAVTLNGREYEGGHVAIVNAEVWERVAQLRKAGARTKGGGRGRRPKGEHLFTRGHLRCGECGQAMIPTTKSTRTPGKLYEVYECYGRKRSGVEFCSQEPIQRRVVDESVAIYFEQRCLDVEATRREIGEAMQRELADVQAVRVAAEHEERAAGETVARVERDYLAGTLSSESYEHLRPIAAAEHEGAKAKAAQLRSREAEVADGGEFRDAEQETLRYVSELRRAIMGQVRDAEGVEAVRAALLRLFECFTLRDDEHGDGSGPHYSPYLVGLGAKSSLKLVPTVREGVLLAGGVGPNPSPIALARAENKHVIGLTR